MNFLLHGNTVITTGIINIRNSNYKFIYDDYENYISDNDFTLVDEECYVFHMRNHNIGHFLYDSFIPFYSIWRQNKKKVYFSVGTSFIRDFIAATIDSKFIQFMDDPSVKYLFSNGYLLGEGRDLKTHSNLNEMCLEIKQAVFSFYQINEQRTDNLLYGRNELAQKRLLKVPEEFISAHDFKRFEFSKMNFEQIVRQLARTKFFVYIVGAGSFYFLFLNENVKVIEINPKRNNSWASNFGLNKIVNFKMYVSNNLQKNESAMNLDEINWDVLFDNALKNFITNNLQVN